MSGVAGARGTPQTHELPAHDMLVDLPLLVGVRVVDEAVLTGGGGLFVGRADVWIGEVHPCRDVFKAIARNQ